MIAGGLIMTVLAVLACIAAHNRATDAQDALRLTHTKIAKMGADHAKTQGELAAALAELNAWKDTGGLTWLDRGDAALPQEPGDLFLAEVVTAVSDRQPLILEARFMMGLDGIKRGPIYQRHRDDRGRIIHAWNILRFIPIGNAADIYRTTGA